MTAPRVDAKEIIPLHCKQTKIVVFKGTFFFCCPHQTPSFYCPGMMYPEPLEPILGN